MGACHLESEWAVEGGLWMQWSMVEFAYLNIYNAVKRLVGNGHIVMEIPVEPKTRSRRSGCDDTRSGPKTPIVGFPKQGRDTRMPGLKAGRNSGDTVRGVNRRRRSLANGL
jgi:hypothetical protein